MSDAELERAAIAPRRWIALSSSKDRTSDELLPSRSTRVIYNPNALEILEREEIDVDEEDLDPYLVPGGRYLVMRGRGCLGVWDLGYDSDEEPSRIWVTRQGSIEGFIVQPTGDGLGIRILAHSYVNNLISEHLHQYSHLGLLPLCMSSRYIRRRMTPTSIQKLRSSRSSTPTG